ncbi:leucine-rich repeat-containing protein 43-like [Pristis pectinata]|uniref:leucine-rich repeat-containing protein 43-like n=1 Tax=Pristis pectinata TaxID=685728 RepID=UPI00223D6564|nr:leucine-rich repeat-containing protein 43-like [Pristis pectinata]
MSSIHVYHRTGVFVVAWQLELHPLATAIPAFQQQMKTLCLNDFPCGTGSWNRSKYSIKEAKSSKLPKYHGEKEEEQDKDVNEEDQQTLKEYLTDEQSPWNGEELSPENQHLRELAISSPSLVNENFLCSKLKTLRIVNKQITEVDKDLLKFQNLEELTLSANGITTLNSANLPRKLKILELCTNEISSLKDLSQSPPPGLQHLGLSYNKLSLDLEYKYLSDEFWPNLISLDLSFNDFVNLLDIVAHLTLLPKLKNLILQGNPFALLPNYRGYVIDTLKNLTALDDVLISSDERHIFMLVSKYEEFNANVARIKLSIGNVTGIPNPIDPLEELPEFPVVKRNYFVTYDFLEDSKDFEVINKETTGNKKQNENSSSEMPSETGTTSTPASPDPVANSPQIEQEQAHSVFTHKIPQKPWADPIVYNYTKEFNVTKLYALKKLLQNGLTIKVIEEKVLSWPVKTLETSEAPTKEKGKGQESAKGGKASAKDQKGKASGKDQKGKASGKDVKKQPTVFQSDTPIERILGTCHVNLHSILAGNNLFEMVCDLGIPENEPKPKPPTPDDKESKKGKSAKKKDDRSSKAEKGNEAKPKSKLKDKLDNKKGKEQNDSELLEEVVPKHLFVEVKLHFQRWFSTADAWKEINSNESAVILLKL